MNVIQPLGAPGKPPAAPLGLGNVDTPPRTKARADLNPWLSHRWWDYAQD